ncbi:hypothetical protein D3C76_709110 [compost metagenome]
MLNSLRRGGSGTIFFIWLPECNVAAPIVSTRWVAAVHGVETRVHSGKLGRHEASRVQPPLTTTPECLSGFPHPIAEPYSDPVSLEGEGSMGNQTRFDRLRRVFPADSKSKQEMTRSHVGNFRIPIIFASSRPLHS